MYLYENIQAAMLPITTASMIAAISARSDILASYFLYLFSILSAISANVIPSESLSPANSCANL
jgi:hypothetical protein